MSELLLCGSRLMRAGYVHPIRTTSQRLRMTVGVVQRGGLTCRPS